MAEDETKEQKQTQPLILKGKGDERHSFCIPAEARNLSSDFNGDVSAPDGDYIEIANNIIRYLKGVPKNITMAQRSNFLPPTAAFYEDSWRRRSIGFLSGERFSFEDEKQLLLSWTGPFNKGLVLDLGTSTGFYARALAAAEKSAEVVAIDISEAMLEEARKRSVAQGVSLYLLKADVCELPFYGNSAGLIVCGGSLNEFSNPEKALYEAKRVLRPDGRLFMMHLLRADTFTGKMAQKASEAGGISFWTEHETELLFGRAGFEIERRLKLGIVMFSLLKPV